MIPFFYELFFDIRVYGMAYQLLILKIALNRLNQRIWGENPRYEAVICRVMTAVKSSSAYLPSLVLVTCRFDHLQAQSSPFLLRSPTAVPDFDFGDKV